MTDASFANAHDHAKLKLASLSVKQKEADIDLTKAPICHVAPWYNG